MGVYGPMLVSICLTIATVPNNQKGHPHYFLVSVSLYYRIIVSICELIYIHTNVGRLGVFGC